MDQVVAKVNIPGVTGFCRSVRRNLLHKDFCTNIFLPNLCVRNVKTIVLDELIETNSKFDIKIQKISQIHS